ncbi:MAG: methyltransferase domain-containing protein [Gammaproteobacteria bacterium]|nr:methyltransferase domain-containing protein [Gammaproteobacteria bacterium]
MSVQINVKERYAEGAKVVQAELCCPVDYDKNLLKILPQEIIEKDYGCGDPSRYVKKGDVVLDLGSGGGKICYMAAQLVGNDGRVIGVDMTDDMLALARKYQDEMAEKIGGSPVTFYRGHIQDLALSLDALGEYLNQNPINTIHDMEALEAWKYRQCQETPMIADDSIDLVISNCVLNLVAEQEKMQLVNEIFRVLKPGGRVAIADIVSDEDIPAHLQNDPQLWSGCISGAFHEKGFLDAFLAAGFVAVGYDKWDMQAWQVVEGIEFRSVTLVATKPHGTECIDRGHAVIYKGPYQSVSDDEGHRFPRGERMAVCQRTFDFLINGPYKDDFIGITPVQLKEAVPFCAPAGTKRLASETKGANYDAGTASSSCC